MNKIVALLAALFAALPLSAQFRTGAGYDDLYDSETVRSFKEHVSFLSSVDLEGRLAGSEGERLAAEYVGQTLEEYGIDLITPRDGQTFGLQREDGDTLTSRNVIGFLQDGTNR